MPEGSSHGIGESQGKYLINNTKDVLRMQNITKDIIILDWIK
jgi:hypothetical protein